MKTNRRPWKKILLSLVVLVSLGVAAQLIVPVVTYNPTPVPVVVSNTDTITTNGNAVTVAPGAAVIYFSNTSIKLEPGFHATAGAGFYATVGSTLDTDGDGIPDVWEKAYGLDPNNPADALAFDLAGDGFTNLQVYLSGGNPKADTNLATATTPPTGYQLVVLTPGNNVYGVNTSNWQITPIARP